MIKLDTFRAHLFGSEYMDIDELSQRLNEFVRLQSKPPKTRSQRFLDTGSQGPFGKYILLY
jgi:hypothetical protein